ncbi:LysM peptidoglycan-binding domain-containing protein [Rhizobium sp. SL86]|uniref:LysM peptidoglycan-binding domain-containing protein n=1 Tax=Rhizobium sp. SL86 TaxID=2995148 RepID=UPI002275E00E|nr:LysM peptidoglycan-binding domain-containing protein [Rhizobium sp. SL86]MCY1664070.1 LysM peptidoglycan-binding domain-containing protein [Rhizobium sp. SL86]
MFKNRAGWLALSALAIATVLMVFFIMPRLSPETQPVGDAINAAGRQIKDAVTQGGNAAKQLVDPTPEKAPASAAKTDAAPAPAAPVQTAVVPQAPRALVIPTFDVLRVEPDGSTVIAGRAEPKAKLEVADQVQTIAMTSVDRAGEFVAIPEQPLPPGDHQLVLKATAEDGRTVISEEIATVSVPKSKDGELLAMVSKPGQPSRILAMPKINETTKTERVAVNAADAAAVPAQTETPKVEATIPVETPKPATPVETASAPAAAATAPVPAAPAVQDEKPALQVTAVEIEGDRLFIAGLSRSGANLKGYANGTLVGEARAGGDGHFVIDGTIALPIGEHRIAVDQLDGNGKVALRVEVPFNRPAGEQVAAVATPQGAGSLNPIDAGAFDKLRGDVARAFQLLQTLFANGATPDNERVAAARSATSIALRALTEYRLPANADANTLAIATNVINEAAAALKALDALPRDVASLAKGLPAIAEMIAKVIGPALPSAPASPLPQAMAEAQQAASAKTIAQAPLTQSEAASVIIRRGDTLWQISRRIYGQGVRYTTIYLANQQQIANPNLIEPGQIFGVPKDSLPDDEAEKIHRRFTKG